MLPYDYTTPLQLTKILPYYRAILQHYHITILPSYNITVLPYYKPKTNLIYIVHFKVASANTIIHGAYSC